MGLGWDTLVLLAMHGAGAGGHTQLYIDRQVQFDLILFCVTLHS